jgi:hypothetical protein
MLQSFSLSDASQLVTQGVGRAKVRASDINSSDQETHKKKQIRPYSRRADAGRKFAGSESLQK